MGDNDIYNISTGKKGVVACQFSWCVMDFVSTVDTLARNPWSGIVKQDFLYT